MRAVTSHLSSTDRKTKGKRNQPIAGPGTAGSASTTRTRADAGWGGSGGRGGEVALGCKETGCTARTRVSSEGEPCAVGRGHIATATGAAPEFRSSSPGPSPAELSRAPSRVFAYCAQAPRPSGGVASLTWTFKGRFQGQAAWQKHPGLLGIVILLGIRIWSLRSLRLRTYSNTGGWNHHQGRSIKQECKWI